MKIVCCIDDFPDVPHEVEKIVSKDSQSKEICFYWLRMGNKSSSPSEQEVDVLEDVLSSKTRSEAHLTARAAVKSIARLNESVSRLDSHQVLFVCDLALENTDWPPPEDDVHANNIERKIKELVEESAVWESARVRAGGYVIHELATYGFDYLISSLNFYPNMERLGIKGPIFICNSKDPLRVSQDVRAQYSKYFWPELTWENLAGEDHERLRSLFEEMRSSSLYLGSHNIQETLNLTTSSLDTAVEESKYFIQKLGINDSDIDDASTFLDTPADPAQQIGIAKTRAIVERIKSDWFLFDWLHMLEKRFGHEVTLDGRAMGNLRDLRSYVHKEMGLNLDFSEQRSADTPSDGGANGLRIKELNNFFAAMKGGEYKWVHSVEETLEPAHAKSGRKSYRYRITVTSNAAPRTDHINLRKLFEGNGNSGLVYRTLRKILDSLGQNHLEYRLIIAENDLELEIANIQLCGLFLIMARSNGQYKMAFVWQQEFTV